MGNVFELFIVGLGESEIACFVFIFVFFFDLEGVGHSHEIARFIVLELIHLREFVLFLSVLGCFWEVEGLVMLTEMFWVGL
jgi:hypothetical protein